MIARGHRVLCVGLTPALQQTMEFTRVLTGEVNRAGTTLVTVAGKAANVARVLHTLGEVPVLTGFNGGDSGRRLNALLAGESIRQRFVSCPQPTRTCVTVVDRHAGTVTELVEEARLPGPAYWRELKAVIEGQLDGSRAVAISGNLPPGAPDDFYAWITARARRAKVPVLIDSSRAALLNALRHQPFLIKLNRRELADTLGVASLSGAALLSGIRRMRTRGAKRVLLTDGPRGAWFASAHGMWRLPAPAIKAVNPIGSGDSVAAGFLHHWLRTQDELGAFAFGLACGTANALTRTPGDLDPAIARRMASELTPRPVR